MSNLVRVDERKNLRRVEVESCTTCKFAFEDFDLYCMLAYTLCDDKFGNNLASYISFDGVSDLNVCDLYERREGG